MLLLLLLALAEGAAARIDVFKWSNETGRLLELSTWMTTVGQFGGTVGTGGLTGLVSVAEPLRGCEPIADVPTADKGQTHFVLIQRGGTNCTFGLKVYHAQIAGYDGAIIYDNLESEELVTMDYKGDLSIHIPSVFVSREAGETITDWVDEYGNETVFAEIWPEVFLVRSFLFTFVSIIAGISVVFTLFLFYRRHTIVSRHRPKARMTRRQALKLPRRSFLPSDADDVCCICLEQYSQGDTITTLPCNHFFHQSCIRPWLQEQQRVCPICKRDPLDVPTEQTPLLGADVAEAEAGTARESVDASINDSNVAAMIRSDDDEARSAPAPPSPLDEERGRLSPSPTSTSHLTQDPSV